ncbi:MAG: hypothetical protein LBU12_08025, partial [Deltaproteobacteria bacterium]|nr:hypothetical protein [Deltaproteobacteria bacterium]
AELAAADFRELAAVCELRHRLTVARSLTAHLEARRETRWPGFGEYSDYPELDESQASYVNSRLIDGRVTIVRRPLVLGDSYEHPPFPPAGERAT